MELTIKDAIKQGYIHAGKPYYDWQSLHKLEDLTNEDIEMEDGGLHLFTKEFKVPFITIDTVREMVADSIEESWTSETGDDTEQVFKAVMELDLDFAAIVKSVNAKVDHIRCYDCTDIKLIKES